MESVLGLQGLDAAPGCCGDPCDHGCGHPIWITVVLDVDLCL